ncbi:protein kinase [Novymonas esmeraldas]|uniref:non-specific serine/threonine protein kinase n=1 Tax=Novymonas esmeraldas TaxID=1808958 RepID=A0AAW0F4N2_9TRYP
MYAVSPATRDGSTNSHHPAFPSCRSGAPTYSRLCDSGSPSSAAAESTLHGGSPTRLKWGAASSPPSSPGPAARWAAASYTHSPDPHHRRSQQQQHLFQSIAAAQSSASQLGFASNDALRTTTPLMALDGASSGLLQSPNTRHVSALPGGSQSPGNHHSQRANETHAAQPGEASLTDKLAPSETLAFSSSHHGTANHPARADTAAIHQSPAPLPSTPQRHVSAGLVAAAGTSPSAAGGGASRGGGSAGPVSDPNTIVPRRLSENLLPGLNASPEGRVATTGAAAGAHRHNTPSSAGWTHEAGGAASLALGATQPPHATGVSTRLSPPAESPPAVSHRAAEAAAASGAAAVSRAGDASSAVPHQSLAPSHLSPEPTSSVAHGQRAPAMFGVIDLSYSRADAGGSKTAPSPVASSGAAAAVSPSSGGGSRPLTLKGASSRASAAVKARASASSLVGVGSGSNGVSSSTTHTDPTAAAAATGGGSVGSANSEFTARYGTTIVRMGHSTTRTESSYSTSQSTQSHSRDATTTTTTTPGYSPRAEPLTPAHATAAAAAAASPRATPPLPPPPPPQADSDDDGEQQQQQQQQQRPRTTPAAMAAARPQKSTTAAAEVSRRPERPTQAPPLTADTVLPVASPDDEARVTSSPATTATTTRSSSNSRAQPSSSASLSRFTMSTATTTPTAGTGRLEKARIPLNGGSHGPRHPATATRDGGQRERLSATFPASGSSFASNVAAVASSASVSSSDGGAAARGAAARGAHVKRRASVGSASAGSTSGAAAATSPSLTSPVLANYAFVSSRGNMQRYIDMWRESFTEDKEAYKEGGYLTVTPGRIVHSRYVLIQKLGWGEFSTVWLGYDTKHATMGRGLSQAFVAVKVAKCRSSVQEATHYEVSLLRYLEARLPRHAAITNIVDCFDVRGEFGVHTCMVMPLCGPNLLSIVDRMKADRNRRNADDLRMIKEIIVSVLISLHELSVLNVVHTDIKPENVLCSAVDSKLVSSMEKFCSYNQERSHMISLDEFKSSMVQQTTDHLVCLADFGLSALLEPPAAAQSWLAMCGKIEPSLLAPLTQCKKNFTVTRPGVMDNHRGTLIQTREYRAPEVVLGLDFTCATDVWSLGCMAFELITGDFLMDPKKKTREPREIDVEHLAMMMQLLGPLPESVTSIRVRNNAHYDALAQGLPASRSAARPLPEHLHRFIDRDGNFIYASRYRSYPRRNLEMELEPYLGFREARLAANFILSCLYAYDPKQRPSAKKLLGHQWFHGVGSPSKDRNSTR